MQLTKKDSEKGFKRLAALHSVLSSTSNRVRSVSYQVFPRGCSRRIKVSDTRERMKRGIVGGKKVCSVL